MKRVEEIKGKRQAQYIFDRQKKAKQVTVLCISISA
jgi:hypothetical protein